MTYPPVPKQFERKDVSRAAARMAYAQIGAASPNHLAGLVGARETRTVDNWLDAVCRMDSGYLRRLLRLALWCVEGWPVSSWPGVDWVGLCVPGLDPADDPFVVVHRTGGRFPFGSPQEQANMIEGVMSKCGIGKLAHLLRLIGKAPSPSSYETLRRWRKEHARPSPLYLARLLIPASWPDSAVGLRDVWRIDWRALKVELVRGFAGDAVLPAELAEIGFECVPRPARPARRSRKPAPPAPKKKRRVQLPPPGPPMLRTRVLPPPVPWTDDEAQEAAD